MTDQHSYKLSHRHLIGLEEYSRRDISLILETAASFKEVINRPIRKVPALRGKNISNMFFESSTRTRLSFELAAKQLSADILNFGSSGSSVSKGESLSDTVRNIEAMQVDCVIVRHSSAGVPNFLSQCLTSAVVINAGDRAHEHPTQGLLDMLTIRDAFGTLDGLKVVLIGDITHSRVARSNIWGLRKMGAHVVVCGPPSLIPKEIDKFGVEVCYRVEEALSEADVIYTLRIQHERQGEIFFPSLREYATLFGIDEDRLNLAKPGAIIMHPGPINRGVELDSRVINNGRSVILDQVTNGIAVRMAVLYLLNGGGEHDAE